MSTIATVQSSTRIGSCDIRTTESKVNVSFDVYIASIVSFRLTDEIDELKVMPVRDSDEELFEMKDLYQRLQTDFQTLRAERDAFYQEIEQKNRIIQKHDSELQKQVETVAHLNHEVGFTFSRVELT